MTTPQDNLLRTKGFVITISETSESGTGEKEAWLTCTGGGDIVEVRNVTHGTDKFHEHVPGHATVSPMILSGYLTSDRKATLGWLQATVEGKPPRRTVTVSPYDIEQKKTRAHNYFDCLIEEYVFPELSSHDHDALKERVTLRPERHEVQ